MDTSTIFFGSTKLWKSIDFHGNYKVALNHSFKSSLPGLSKTSFAVRAATEGRNKRQQQSLGARSVSNITLVASSSRCISLKSTQKFEDSAADNEGEASKQRESRDVGNESVSTGEETNFKVDERSNSGGSVLSFLCPLLKVLGGQDPTKPRNTYLETATSGFSSLARLPWGSRVIPEVSSAQNRKQPLHLFQLYEFEACPFCRRVREALTELDLSAEVYPCPKGSMCHRPYVFNFGGKEQFPYFVDPNKGVALYESSDIVRYLFQEYGEGTKPSFGLLESTPVTGWVPTILRVGRGMTVWKKRCQSLPAKMIRLYSYENNQFARIVREALCELEIPYILRNVGKGSAYASELLQISGSTKVPFLVDPNTGVNMGNSLSIVSYLFDTYATKS